MRRAIARGRLFPQSYSTDRRYGRLSLKACALFPLMWANADDQGRLSGDPEEIKYACCPNIDHITKVDIPQISEELAANSLIKVYASPQSAVIQMLDWWAVQRLQWAWPSDYPPPEGWKDRLRYKRGALEVVTVNWPPQVSPQVSNSNVSGETSGEQEAEGFPHLPNDIKEESRKKRGRGRGNSREPLISSQVSNHNVSGETSGERASPTLSNLSILNFLIATFPKAFGRKPDSRETAQLRDLGAEISTAGGATAEQIHDAFKEAAVHQKFSISYVRAILLDWLGVARAPPQ